MLKLFRMNCVAAAVNKHSTQTDSSYLFSLTVLHMPPTYLVNWLARIDKEKKRKMTI